MYIDSRSLKALIIFIIILSAFFIYFIISEGIDNDKQAKDRQTFKDYATEANKKGNTTDRKLNTTLTKLSMTEDHVDAFISAWVKKMQIDSVRYNTTLDTLNKTYSLIVDNQGKIINLTNLQIKLTDLQNNNTARNLNLTKFNRAALVDTNNIVRELADYLNLTDIKQFNGSKLG
jgi:hypothetical protein